MTWRLKLPAKFEILFSFIIVLYSFLLDQLNTPWIHPAVKLYVTHRIIVVTIIYKFDKELVELD